MQPNNVRQHGFTLLGLLFLVAVMGVGMAALGAMWHTAAQREKERELLFAGDQYRRAIESFWKASRKGEERLPKNLDELLEDPRFPNTVRHLRRLYPDPMTGSQEWGMVKGADGGIAGVHSLFDGKPFQRANFPPAYSEFAELPNYRAWVFRFAAGAPTEAAAATDAALSEATPADAQNTNDPSRQGEQSDTPEWMKKAGACHANRIQGNLACQAISGEAARTQCANAVSRQFSECLAAR
jgi:type II secretory pathway pseudopilin PulG